MCSNYLPFRLYLLLAFVLFIATTAQAQYFGRNKPAYKKFDFQVMESPNFRLYHYFHNKEAAVSLLQDSERWYKVHQQVLRDTFATPNPIIIYKNHADFQQTTAISGSISVGTGGVTEGLKNRVVMPVTLSNKQTDHVLGHELVHAHQYNMLRTGDSTSLTSIRNLPLWMVEGLAEYMSLGSVDPNTAMWMRDAVLHKDIPTLRDLTRKPKYFPYRWGQAFWSFVAGAWGDEVIRPLFISTARYGYAAALDSVLKVNEKALSNMWKEKLQEYYAPYLAKADTLATGTRMLQGKNPSRMNLSPMISPNGRYVAYMSEQNVISLDLYLADVKTGKIIKRLASSTQSEHLDNFNFLESAGTWSPFGERFAFVVFDKGINRLAIVDVARARIIDHLDLPGVDAFSYPAWSPDGNRLVVSGLVEGQSDLYLYDLRTRKVTQLTHDKYSDLMPAWSADGSRLVFSSDRPLHGQPYDIGKRSYRLTELVLETGQLTIADVFEGADNLNPVYDPAGASILFLSDRDGYRNMYRYYPQEGRVEQLTNYATGISGITSLSPAMSVARDEGTVSYTFYKKGDYLIYNAPLSAFKATPVDPKAVDFRAGVLPPLERNKALVDANLASLGNLADPVAKDSLKELPYKPNFKLDYISNTAGVGLSSGPFGTGIQGGVNAIFSDMIGNNQLFAAAALNGEIYDFGAQVAYLRQRGKLQWGVSAGHIPFLSARIGFRPDSVDFQDTTVLADNMILQQIRTFQQQVSVIGNYVISPTRRFEFGGGISRYSYRIDQFNNYYLGGFYYKTERERIPAPEGFTFEQVYAAYVGDKSVFGLTSPLAGRRYRLHAERYFGALNIWTGLIDFRQYVQVKPFSLAFRVMHQARFGKDVDNGELPPMAIIYPTLIRGFGDKYFYKSQEHGDGSFNFSHLYGNRIAVANAEIRLPLTGPERLAQIKSGLLFSDLNLFVDGGLAWNGPGEATEGLVGTNVRYRPLISTGLSLRVNLFGYMVIEPFYAIPLERNGLKLASFGLNFAPGW